MNNFAKVYISDTDDLNEPELFDYYYKRVGDLRRDAVDRLKLQKDKNLSLAAGALLKYGLELHGFGVDDVYKDQNKKLHLKSRSLCFNLSHSGNKAMLVLSNNEVGCDVQKIGNFNPAVAKRVFSNAEYTKLVSMSQTEKNNYFYRLWSLKESLVKTSGCGLFGFDKSISIDLSVEPLKAECNDQVYWFYEINRDDGYKYAFSSAFEIHEVVGPIVLEFDKFFI